MSTNRKDHILLQGEGGGGREEGREKEAKNGYKHGLNMRAIFFTQKWVKIAQLLHLTNGYGQRFELYS